MDKKDELVSGVVAVVFRDESFFPLVIEPAKSFRASIEAGKGFQAWVYQSTCTPVTSHRVSCMAPNVNTVRW